ncbi:uncharacterized protein RB166_007967 [Leptodactylus fuscus]|uniref:uncharacterized protein LOC142204418 n=1 Tax=Leptodactylus fuscus TaxID=238119 RepID=UPI003F4EF4D3
MRRSILLLYFLHGTCWTSEYYCIYQPNHLYVNEGDSAAIPCTYTYPERLGWNSQTEIRWGEGNGRDCGNIRKHITDESGNVIDEYKDQISTVHHPGNQTASILIQGLKPLDGVTFCCTATIPNIIYNWYDPDGTTLTLTGGKWLSQVEELMAVRGEEMIIPCNYPMETMGEALQVTWYIGDSKLCANNNNKKTYTYGQTQTREASPYSLVNFPEDVSLRIHRLQSHNYLHFCCRVTTSNGTLESRYSTEVTIADTPSSLQFNVKQPSKPYEVTHDVDESVTLSCSYSKYSESDVLKVNIYWRVGNKTGPYAYHPYKEMVHPDYRGRTEIKGAADLHIRGVRRSDDSTYYCFVMLKLCTGNSKYTNSIWKGKGTRLIVRGKITDRLDDVRIRTISMRAISSPPVLLPKRAEVTSSDPTTESPNDPDEQQLIIIVSASAAAMLVLLCVILIILKVTGPYVFFVQCKDILDSVTDRPTNVSDDPPMGPSSNTIMVQ